MGLGRCVVTHIICTGMQKKKKKFHALWSLMYIKNPINVFIMAVNNCNVCIQVHDYSIDCVTTN